MALALTEENLRKGFHKKRVFLTGHTGFKGAWLLQALHWLGADVKGFSLTPENTPDLYNQINGDKLCYTSVINDIRSLSALQEEIFRFQPHYIFHLAAQAFVRRSYKEPAYTFEVNANGTLNVLEALRAYQNKCVAIMVTTDKVYQNPERGIPFTETDKLGGNDPYSASKAAAEIIIESYRSSFFSNETLDKHQKSIASVRAGNVIGGGDYSEDRIVPDIIKSLELKEKVVLRHPYSIRPWQHVLEPIFAYLQLALNIDASPSAFNTAYNIGPVIEEGITVEDLTKTFLNHYPEDAGYKIDSNYQGHKEAKLLLLDSKKIARDIGFTPKLSAHTAIEWTADWYSDKTSSAAEKCKKQFLAYLAE